MTAVIICLTFCMSMIFWASACAAEPARTGKSLNIVQEGACGYRVLYANDTESQNAADTLKKQFQLSSEVTLDTVADNSQQVFSESVKVISIGETSYASSAEVSYLPPNESAFRISVKGESVFVLGGKLGIAYGTYELMKAFFDYEVFAEDCIHYQTGASDVKVYVEDFEGEYVPSFEYRSVYNRSQLSEQWKNSQHQNDFGLGQYMTVHNSLKYLPKNEYASEHPEWYDYAAGQLCYYEVANSPTAIGIVAGKMKQFLPTRTYDSLLFGAEDNEKWCSCEHCLGNESYWFVEFINRLADAIKPDFPSVTIVGMAYQKNIQPPISESGEPTIQCRDNAGIMVGLINSNYYIGLKQDTRAASIIDGWSKVADGKLWYWLYSQKFRFYMYFFDTFGSMQETYQYIAEKGAIGIRDQGQWNQPSHTAFNSLRDYLDAKLYWDVDCDYEYYMDRFFTYYFGPAADKMRSVFETMRSAYQTAYQTYPEIGTPNSSTYFDLNDPLNQNHRVLETVWPEQTLLSLLQGMEEAYGLAGSDEAVVKRIKRESIFVRFALISLYDNDCGSTSLTEAKKELIRDCQTLNITRTGEASADTVERVCQVWGLS